MHKSKYLHPLIFYHKDRHCFLNNKWTHNCGAHMPGLNITYILGPQGVRVGYAYIFLPGGKFKTFQISSSASSKYSGYHWGLDGLQFHFMNYTYIFEKLNWPYKKGTFFLMPLHKVCQFLTKSLIWDKLWNDSKSFLCTGCLIVKWLFIDGEKRHKAIYFLW